MSEDIDRHLLKASQLSDIDLLNMYKSPEEYSYTNIPVAVLYLEILSRMNKKVIANTTPRAAGTENEG